jgi:hypothetical protein
MSHNGSTVPFAPEGVNRCHDLVTEQRSVSLLEIKLPDPQPRRRDLHVQVDAVSTNPLGLPSSHTVRGVFVVFVTDHSLGLKAVLACP